MRKHYLFLFVLAHSLLVLGQNPKLQVLTDSVKIGESFQASLTYQHKPNSEVFFPDSSFDYGVLEYIKHSPYPTKTDSLSLDSAVYTLVNFNIQDSTEIKLPLYILTRNDSIKIESNSNFIYTNRTLTQLPDSLQLKTQLEYIRLKSPVNFALLIVVGTLIISALLILLIVFRKKIKKFLKNHFLKKKCQKIFNALEVLIQTEKYDASVLNDYSGLSKKGLEYIFKTPVSTFTSSQIKERFQNDFNTELFSELDKHIYRSSEPQNIRETLQQIKADLEFSLEQQLNLKDE